MAIPYTIAPFTNGQVVGFDVQVNDDNGAGERTGIANWSDVTGMGYTNTSGFGVLKLTGGSDTPTLLCGDANDNGEVEVADAVYILQGIADPSNSDYVLTETGRQQADADGNGSVDAQDALAIQMYMAEMIDTLPYTG